MLLPSICDVIRNLSGIWKLMFPEVYSRYFDVPQHYQGDIGGSYYVNELRELKEGLEALGGRKISDDDLRASIAVYNGNRRLIRKVYDFRSAYPWKAPSSEVYLLMRAGMFLPVEEHSRLLTDYLAAAGTEDRRVRDNCRVVLHGAFCEQPPLNLIKSIELSGCYIVDDDFMMVNRWLKNDVPADGDPLQNLADAFLTDSMDAAAKYEPDGDAKGKSDFFRDIAGGMFMSTAETVAKEAGLPYDVMLNIYDKSIIEVENRPPGGDIKGSFLKALSRVSAETPGADITASDLQSPLNESLDIELDETFVVGTGYGGERLPFLKDHIRSEILCHGLGAHMMYPETRTVLDIGGQDTKAIQVDGRGIVENSQMNDRCAAGCGRYLGYIADETNIGVHELGPLASKSTKVTKINSTCTVFAGAELRDRLALGEKREDVLAGLHRAIISRAMSVNARSGGITDQFTFTGGVANNNAAVKELKNLVQKNYGDVSINIDLSSIYTGAVGGAEIARRAALEGDTALEGEAA